MAHDLLLLTAPPAAGKTYLINNLLTQLDQTPLVIVPLRALANECQSKWQESCVVMTPEEWLLNKSFHSVVIIDEFHLFFYWGDTFRHRMWECFFEVVSQAKFTLLLTATMTAPMIKEISHFESHFDRLLWVDCGNQTLKYQPARYLKIPHRRWLWDSVGLLKPHRGTALIFCQYRHEVSRWVAHLRSQGFETWGCVGGGAREFSSLVRTGIVPDFIVATTVLSHGVNLPQISRIFFTYSVGNLDFWIQMVARGGRRGEAFDVFSVESPHGLRWNRFTNFLAIQFLSLKMAGKKFYLAFVAWFLKV